MNTPFSAQGTSLDKYVVCSCTKVVHPNIRCSKVKREALGKRQVLGIAPPKRRGEKLIIEISGHLDVIRPCE